MSEFRQLQYGISVIMPVHNGGHYLREAVDSILQQSGVLLELIIIDDHSTDDALQQLPEDTRIVLCASPARGIVAALNHALLQAKYPFIARMDCDDIAQPHRLKTQLQYLLRNPHVDICGACVTVFRDNSEKVQGGYQLYQQWINSLCDHRAIEREFFVESTIPHPSAMWRKEVVDQLGGYHDQGWPEDYDLWCRALLAGLRFGKPEDQILLNWRDHSGRLSRNDSRYTKQQFLRCKARYLADYLQQRGHTEATIWGAGKTGLKMHDYLEDRGLAISGFIDVNDKLISRTKRGKLVRVINTTTADFSCPGWTCPASSSMVLVAVSARGARAQIREFLDNCGWQEQKNFLLIA